MSEFILILTCSSCSGEVRKMNSDGSEHKMSAVFRCLNDECAAQDHLRISLDNVVPSKSDFQEQRRHYAAEAI